MIYETEFGIVEDSDGEWYARILLIGTSPDKHGYIWNKAVAGYGNTRAEAIADLTNDVADLEAQAKAARQALDDFLVEDAT